jgi:hypothetical protein
MLTAITFYETSTVFTEYCGGRGGGSAMPEFRLGTALSKQTISALLTGFQVLLLTMH